MPGHETGHKSERLPLWISGWRGCIFKPHMSLQLKGYSCNCGIVSHWRAYTPSTCIYIYIHTFRSYTCLFSYSQQEQQWLWFCRSTSRAAQRSHVRTDNEKVSLEKGQEELLETQHQRFNGLYFLLFFMHKSVRTKPKQDVHVHQRTCMVCLRHIGKTCHDSPAAQTQRISAPLK